MSKCVPRERHPFYVAVALMRPCGQGVAPMRRTRTQELNAALQGDRTRGGRSAAKAFATGPETTLGSLATKFVDLMMRSPGGSVDLNKAAELLHAKKRRIYDVTNVLQGVDLIEKGRKNTVQWKGDLNASADDHTDAQTAMLRQQISELEETGQTLDRQISFVREELIKKARDRDFRSQMFVRVSDLGTLEELKGRNVFVIRGPRSTEIQMPKDIAGDEPSSKALVTSLGRIEVALFNASCMDKWEEKQKDPKSETGTIKEEEGAPHREDVPDVKERSILMRDLRQ